MLFSSHLIRSDIYQTFQIVIDRASKSYGCWYDDLHFRPSHPTVIRWPLKGVIISHRGQVPCRVRACWNNGKCVYKPPPDELVVYMKHVKRRDTVHFQELCTGVSLCSVLLWFITGWLYQYSLGISMVLYDAIYSRVDSLTLGHCPSASEAILRVNRWSMDQLRTNDITTFNSQALGRFEISDK